MQNVNLIYLKTVIDRRGTCINTARNSYYQRYRCSTVIPISFGLVPHTDTAADLVDLINDVMIAMTNSVAGYMA